MSGGELTAAAIILFMAGAVTGSFLNVVIFRSITGESINGRSRCRQCRKTLGWQNLVPILSYLMQRGRCQACRGVISPQYPLVEISLGLLMPALLMPLPLAQMKLVLAILTFIIAALLVVLFVIDLRTMLLPDIFVFGLAIVVLGYLLVSAWPLEQARLSEFFVAHTLGAAVGGGFMALLYIITSGRGIGLGDVKLMLVLGALFGPINTAVLLWIAFTSGGLVAVFLLARGLAGAKTAIPFGPFLTGTAITLLVLPQLASDIARQFFWTM